MLGCAGPVPGPADWEARGPMRRVRSVRRTDPTPPFLGQPARPPDGGPSRSHEGGNRESSERRTPGRAEKTRGWDPLWPRRAAALKCATESGGNRKEGAHFCAKAYFFAHRYCEATYLCAKEQLLRNRRPNGQPGRPRRPASCGGGTARDARKDQRAGPSGPFLLPSWRDFLRK